MSQYIYQDTIDNAMSDFCGSYEDLQETYLHTVRVLADEAIAAHNLTNETLASMDYADLVQKVHGLVVQFANQIGNPYSVCVAAMAGSSRIDATLKSILVRRRPSKYADGIEAESRVWQPLIAAAVEAMTFDIVSEIYTSCA